MLYGQIILEPVACLGHFTYVLLSLVVLVIRVSAALLGSAGYISQPELFA